MTIRPAARVAGVALIATQIAAVGPHVGSPSGGVALTIVVATQVAGLWWSTDRRTADGVRVVAPAALAGITAGAAWTFLAVVVPEVASGDVPALVVIGAAGVVVAVNPPRGAVRRWPLAAVASAVTALLIVVAVTCLLPALPGYVSNWAPPTYTDVARLVDPILEFAVYALLTVAVGAHVWLERIRRRRVTTRPEGIAPDEMVVLPPAPMDPGFHDSTQR